MTRRITIPEDHVAVILPNQLADELTALCNIIRRSGKTLRLDFSDNGDGKTGMKAIAGDVLLACLDARES